MRRHLVWTAFQWLVLPILLALLVTSVTSPVGVQAGKDGVLVVIHVVRDPVCLGEDHGGINGVMGYLDGPNGPITIGPTAEGGYMGYEYRNLQPGDTVLAGVNVRRLCGSPVRSYTFQGNTNSGEHVMFTFRVPDPTPTSTPTVTLTPTTTPTEEVITPTPTATATPFPPSPTPTVPAVSPTLTPTPAYVEFYSPANPPGTPDYTGWWTLLGREVPHFGGNVVLADSGTFIDITEVTPAPGGCFFFRVGRGELGEALAFYIKALHPDDYPRSGECGTVRPPTPTATQPTPEIVLPTLAVTPVTSEPTPTGGTTALSVSNNPPGPVPQYLPQTGRGADRTEGLKSAVKEISRIFVKFFTYFLLGVIIGLLYRVWRYG